MAIQLGVTTRNARLDAIETAVSTAPKLRIYSGSAPADCAAAATGTVLVDGTCPSDWMAAASAGSKAKSGTWSFTGAANGSPGYFRVWNNGLTVCHIQGTVTVTGGGGDLTLDSVPISSGQSVVINTFTLTDGNA